MTEAFLRNVALFRGLSGEEIEAVAKSTTSRQFGRGSTIILAEQQNSRVTRSLLFRKVA